MSFASAGARSRRSAHLLAATVLAALVAVAGPAVVRLSTASAGPRKTATVATQTITTAAAATPLVGFNEQWLSQAPLTQVLTDADISRIKATGATAVRFPVRCFVVGACSYDQRYNDSIDFSKVTSWDFTQLDAAISKLKAAGITPVVGPHPGDRMYRPGYIVDDQEYASTTAFVQAVVGHLNGRFGPLPYSFFETDQNTSLVTGADGVSRYRYMTAAGFPANFTSALTSLYNGDISALNAAYGTTYPSFDAVPLPDLGTSLGVPAAVYDSPATYDLRRIIGSLSASRYSAIGDVIHSLSPGSEWWGPTVQLQSFHDLRQIHSATQLTPVGPTLSDLAAQPGIDVLSVDGYRNNATWTAAAEWRVASKTAARAGKRLAITEIGDQTTAALQVATTAVQKGASNLRAVLVWQAKDDPSSSTTYGMIDKLGAVRTDRSNLLTSFFGGIKTNAASAVYQPGVEAVYYPEWSFQVVQSGKLTSTKTLALMGDLMAAGYSVEPVVDSEVVGGTWTRLSVYSLYLGDAARAALASMPAKPVFAYQYASHRTGFTGGHPVDTALWAARDGFSASGPEGTARVAETVQLLGGSFPVALDYRLQGWPFVHLTSTGSTAVIGTHSAAVCGCAMTVRTASGSVWSDEYVGGNSVTVLYGAL